jgi:TetR/AcrR family transcriptional repressor of nem operon
MPWPREHKARTRKRIVQAAAAAFRARGVSQVGVDEVMESAGLTRGGFYAHFGSKDDLVDAALDEADAETLAFLANAAEGNSRRRLHAVVDAYLSSLHAEHPEHGCPIAALAPEVARGSQRNRRHVAARLFKRLEWMTEMLPARRKSADAVVPLLACMVGGVVLARAAGREKGPAILAACRTFLHRAIAEID